MKKNLDERWFEDAFLLAEKNAAPSEAQERAMLERVLVRARSGQATTKRERIARWITNYPWRFAFGLSAAQAVVCSLIWGEGYARFILQTLL